MMTEHEKNEIRKEYGEDHDIIFLDELSDDMLNNLLESSVKTEDYEIAAAIKFTLDKRKQDNEEKA